MILWQAFGARRTDIRIYARIDADGILARLIAGTVAVAAATDHFALFVWVSTISAQTAAFGTISIWIAFGIRTARLFDETRIDAVAIDAGFARFAFAVDATSNCTAHYVRISFVAWFA